MDEYFYKCQGFIAAFCTLLTTAMNTESTGVTAVIDALSLLGGPFSIFGGICFLVGLSTITYFILKYLTYAIVFIVVKILKKMGKTKPQIIRTLKTYPFWSLDLSFKASKYIDGKIDLEIYKDFKKYKDFKGYIDFKGYKNFEEY